MEFRKLNPLDLKQLIAYYQEVCDEMQGKPDSALWEYGIYPTQEDLETFLRAGEFYGLFCKDQLIAAGAVCFRGQPGYESVDWIQKEGEIATWHLISSHPAFRRQKAAQMLLDHLLQDLSFDAIHLDLVLDNEAAARLYLKKGFTDHGIAMLYYPDNGWTENRVFEYLPKKE